MMERLVRRLRWLLAVAGAVAMATLLAKDARAQQCGPRQVFDQANLALGRLACQDCQQSADARATARSTGQDDLQGTIRALSEALSDLNQRVQRLDSPGGEGGASAYATANGAARPLALRTNRPRASAHAESNSGGYDPLPPPAVASANSDVREQATANSNGCNGGRSGLLGRLAGRRQTTRSVAITRTNAR